MTSAPEQRGLPFFNDPHWDPLWATAQDLDIPVHFHGSGGTRRMRIDLMPGMSSRRNRAITGSIGFNLQGQYMSNFLFSGVFNRFPKLTFVIAETVHQSGQFVIPRPTVGTSKATGTPQVAPALRTPP